MNKIIAEVAEEDVPCYKNTMSTQFLFVLQGMQNTHNISKSGKAVLLLLHRGRKEKSCKIYRDSNKTLWM